MTTPPPSAAPRGTDRTTMWGVLGIIVGLLCCGILGIIFGVLSIQHAKRSGKSPVLGYLAIAAGVLSIVWQGSLFAAGAFPWQD